MKIRNRTDLACAREFVETIERKRNVVVFLEAGAVEVVTDWWLITSSVAGVSPGMIR